MKVDYGRKMEAFGRVQMDENKHIKYTTQCSGHIIGYALISLAFWGYNLSILKLINFYVKNITTFFKSVHCKVIKWHFIMVLN